MSKWYMFNSAAANEGDAATVSIYDEIGAWGLNAADFARDLKNISAKVLNVEINSPGGSVFDGIAIYNALRASGKTINVKVMGIAASVASIIAMAGDKISMPENTFMMIHNPWGMTVGNASELREFAGVLDKIGDGLVATYMRRTGQSEASVKADLAAETWMTAAEAKEKGYADEVTGGIQVSAKFDPASLPANVKAVFASGTKKKPADEAPPASPDELPPEAPGPDTEPEQTPAPAQDKPPASPNTLPIPAAFADEVLALASAAGFEAFAAQWSIEHEDIETVKAQIAVAREVRALCAVAKRPQDADALVAAGKTLADARSHLMTALALADERAAIDTTLKNSTQPKSEPPATGFTTTAAAWATYRKQGAKA